MDAWRSRWLLPNEEKGDRPTLFSVFQDCFHIAAKHLFKSADKKPYASAWYEDFIARMAKEYSSIQKLNGVLVIYAGALEGHIKKWFSEFEYSKKSLLKTEELKLNELLDTSVLVTLTALLAMRYFFPNHVARAGQEHPTKTNIELLDLLLEVYPFFIGLDKHVWSVLCADPPQLLCFVLQQHSDGFSLQKRCEIYNEARESARLHFAVKVESPPSVSKSVEGYLEDELSGYKREWTQLWDGLTEPGSKQRKLE